MDFNDEKFRKHTHTSFELFTLICLFEDKWDQRDVDTVKIDIKQAEEVITHLLKIFGMDSKKLFNLIKECKIFKNLKNFINLATFTEQSMSIW